MPAPLITDDFLLENRVAVELYHGHAKQEPILDYHCHLPPAQIAEDKRFANLTQVWLYGDHYKWRAMRADGVAEKYCTGNATDWEKFLKWAETVPHLLRNPLHHWTHLELARPFGIRDRLLDAATARGIWEECNAKLARPEFSARGLMRQMNVVLVCTTDDPTDDLAHHRHIAADKTFPVRVLPAFRPDKAMAVEDPALFRAWVEKLEHASNRTIRTFTAFREALCQRHDFFHAQGCRLSDHGLETAYAEPYTERELGVIFEKARAGKAVSTKEVLKFKSAMLYEFGLLDHAKGWTQQYHFSALRNNNTRLLTALGPDTGFDAIGDFELGRPLARMLDRLDREDHLARTIVYSLNPGYNELLASIIGSFQDGSVPGKMQLGSAWWFLDQRDGMEAQMRALSNIGLLSRFVGMLTDSRSFLSYTRHEYFRRLLCHMLGDEVERGLLPRDIPLLGEMVRDICYRNAERYFRFGAASRK